MKALLVSEGGECLGLGCRLSRDGHDCLLVLLPGAPSHLGEGLVKTAWSPRRDLRAVLMAIKSFGPDLVVVDSLSLVWLANGLRDRGIRVFGPSEIPKSLPVLPEKTRFEGMVVVGGVGVIKFKGGIMFHPVKSRILSLALRASSEHLLRVPMKKDGIYESFETPEGRWETQAFIPAVWGALLELVKGDVGLVFEEKHRPVVADRAEAISVSLDLGCPEGRLESVPPEGLKHLYPVSARLEGQMLKGCVREGELGTLCYSCSYGIGLNEANRRASRNIELGEPFGVKVKNQRLEVLEELLG